MNRRPGMRQPQKKGLSVSELRGFEPPDLLVAKVAPDGPLSVSAPSGAHGASDSYRLQIGDEHGANAVDLDRFQAIPTCRGVPVLPQRLSRVRHRPYQ